VLVLAIVTLQPVSAFSTVENASATKNPELKYVDFTTKHACVCSNSTGICRCFVHVVFTATPAEITNSLIGGGSYTTSTASDAPVMKGRDTAFERHIVNGICNCNTTYCDYAGCDNTTGVAQMWNWGFEDTAPIEDVATLPSTICPQIWMKDLQTGGRSSFSVPCLDMPVAIIDGGDEPSLTAINDFSSAATHVTSKSTGLSRSNVHIVFTVAPSDPTHVLIGGGSYSFDHGQSWHSEGTSVYYEQHIDLSGDRYYQAWQFDWDRVSKDSSFSAEVCYKVWLTNTNTAETVWLNATSGAVMHCMKVCKSIVQFHWPAGYCGADDALLAPLLL